MLLTAGELDVARIEVDHLAAQAPHLGGQLADPAAEVGQTIFEGIGLVRSSVCCATRASCRCAALASRTATVDVHDPCWGVG